MNKHWEPWEDDDWDEEGSDEDWIRAAQRERENWICLFPGECVMGHCDHHRDECMHFDDAAAHFEMREEDCNSTIE